MKSLIAFAPRWGSHFGGINSFNLDLLGAFSAAFFRQALTVCVVLHADEAEIAAAAGEQVVLVPLGLPGQDAFAPALEAVAWNALRGKDIEFDAESTVWLGHDRITGEIALAAARARGGRSALIHHMSYSRYEAFAESSALANQKEGLQKALFQAADHVLAVGPLLRDALDDMLGAARASMLVPGLPEISAKATPKSFRVFLSGRLSEDTKKIKQAHLGIAAFANAIRQADENPGLPDALRGENEPGLILRGVDFEASGSRNGNDQHEAEQGLRLFAESYACRAVRLHALPFTTTREVLFDDLSSATVALMPSWHEGFGLVAWEAIAAGVPLILSKKSGAYRQLKEFKQGLYTSYVTPIDVAGSSGEPFFLPKDLDELSKAIVGIAKDPHGARQKAASLREALIAEFSWFNCANQLAAVLGWSRTSDESEATLEHRGAANEARRGGATPGRLLELPSPSWRPSAGLSDSQLLRAEEAIIDFDPRREPFLREQLDWTEATEYPVAIRLLTGAGGLGKTRLALELCNRLASQGWQVGFVRSDFDAGQSAKLAGQVAEVGKPCLVVFDYAETRQREILATLKSLILLPHRRQVRILLLARDAGEWWDLLPEKEPACEALLTGLATGGPFELPQLYDGEDERHAAYSLALRTFAGRLQLASPDDMPRLAEAHFAHPLFVQMAALTALRGERPKSAEGLPRALVNHERRYWRKALSDSGPDADGNEQLAALFMTLATLANGIQTDRSIEGVWLAADADKSTLRRLFRVLAPLYPDWQGIQGLRPDLIGEALVAQVLLGSKGPSLLEAVLGQGNQRLRQSSLTVLARLLRYRADVAPILEDSLVSRLPSCASAVFDVCIETPSPLPQVAERAFVRLTKSQQWQVAGMLASRFEFEVLPLTGLGVLVQKTLVQKAEAKRPAQSIEVGAEHAGALANYSVSLHRHGLDDEALGAAEQALAIHRKLAEAKPERFEPDLARSLSNYAGHLSEQGRTDDALAAADQAVAILRRLAQAKPERFEPDLATTLSNYASHLSEQGRTDEALAAADQALAILRRLAQAKPERFEPDLATTLSNYASHLSEQGRTDEALAAAEQALAIRRKLAQAKPERFESDLATSLSNYANRLSEQGRTDEALAAAEQTLAIRRKLAQAKPKRFEPELATSLSNYDSHLSELGRADEGLAAAEQALAILRTLSQVKPERFEPDLARTLSNYANRLSELGRANEALAAAEQALAIRRQLAQAKPKRFESELATSLSNCASYLSELGRADEGLAAAEQALAILRTLSQVKPERFEPDLARSLSNYAGHLSEQGRTDEALAAAEQALAIRRELAQAKPKRFESELATSLSNCAGHLSELGRTDDALASAEQALATLRRLAQAKPERFEPNLATTLTNYANRLSEQGRADDAVDAAEQALAIRRRLAQAKPHRFLAERENSRLQMAFLRWVASGATMLPEAAAPLPVLSNPRQQREVAFHRQVLLALAAPHSTTEGTGIEHALAVWAALDTGHQHEWKAFHLLLQSMAARFLRVDTVLDGWRDEVSRFRNQRRGFMPRWMTETARRLELDL